MESTEKNESTTTEIVVSVDFSATEKDLAEAEHRFKSVVHDVTTKTGMKAAKADIGVLRTMRTTTDKKRLEVGRVLLAEKAKIDEKAKAIIGRIVALEEPLKLQVGAEEARVEAERLAAIQAEQERVDTITGKINAFRELAGKVSGWPSGRIAVERDKLLSLIITSEEFQEYTPQALDAWEAACARLDVLLREARAAEEEAERVRQLEEAHRAQQAELEKLRQEAKEREEEAARKAAEAERAEQKRLDEIKARIGGIRAMASDLRGMGMGELEEVQRGLVTMHPDRTGIYGEWHSQAMEAYTEAYDAISKAIEDRAQRDAKEAAEKAAQAERERQAEAQRQEALRKAEEARKAADKAKADAKAERLARIGLRDFVEQAHAWFVQHGETEMAEQAAAALANDKKATKA